VFIPVTPTDNIEAVNFMKESSPLIVRLGNYIQITDNTFTDNSAINTGDIYFGAAITLDKLLGFS
jgi:hypothetical protein